MKCTYIYRLRFYTIHIVHILTARICLFIYAYIKWLHYTTLAIYFPPIMIASQMYFMYIMLLRFTHNICMYLMYVKCMSITSSTTTYYENIE